MKKISIREMISPAGGFAPFVFSLVAFSMLVGGFGSFGGVLYAMDQDPQNDQLDQPKEQVKDEFPEDLCGEAKDWLKSIFWENKFENFGFSKRESDKFKVAFFAKCLADFFSIAKNLGGCIGKGSGSKEFLDELSLRSSSCDLFAKENGLYERYSEDTIEENVKSVLEGLLEQGCIHFVWGKNLSERFLFFFKNLVAIHKEEKDNEKTEKMQKVVDLLQGIIAGKQIVSGIIPPELLEKSEETEESEEEKEKKFTCRCCSEGASEMVLCPNENCDNEFPCCDRCYEHGKSQKYMRIICPRCKKVVNFISSDEDSEKEEVEDASGSDESSCYCHFCGRYDGGGSYLVFPCKKFEYCTDCFTHKFGSRYYPDAKEMRCLVCDNWVSMNDVKKKAGPESQDDQSDEEDEGETKDEAESESNEVLSGGEESAADSAHSGGQDGISITCFDCSAKKKSRYVKYKRSKAEREASDDKRRSVWLCGECSEERKKPKQVQKEEK